MHNYKFTPNKWIIFDYLFDTAIGITSVKEGKQVVTFVSESGAVGEVLFKSIDHPRELCIKKGESKTLEELHDSYPDSVISYIKGEA